MIAQRRGHFCFVWLGSNHGVSGFYLEDGDMGHYSLSMKDLQEIAVRVIYTVVHRGKI